MYSLAFRNVHEALPKGMRFMADKGVKRPSRAGEVLTVPEPVSTCYLFPKERVLFWRERDANPFFHFMEGLWMLAGRRDVKWISRFNSTFAQFSDDGEVFHGAYGYRWRHHFSKIDQIDECIRLLKENPNDRRVVMQMWDPVTDLGQEGKDFPCNTQIKFRVNPYGYLDMHVTNRSNDMIWGAYGANAVHMSMLHEMMSFATGIPIGRYWQISMDFHVYLETWEKHEALLHPERPLYNPYETGEVEPFPMINSSYDIWMKELETFIYDGPVIGFVDPFFRKVAVPIWQSWMEWKSQERGNVTRAIDIVENCAASDWRRACAEWLARRAK
jgi:thymidylate synthase